MRGWSASARALRRLAGSAAVGLIWALSAAGPACAAGGNLAVNGDFEFGQAVTLQRSIDEGRGFYYLPGRHHFGRVVLIDEAHPQNVSENVKVSVEQIAGGPRRGYALKIDTAAVEGDSCRVALVGRLAPRTWN